MRKQKLNTIQIHCSYTTYLTKRNIFHPLTPHTVAPRALAEGDAGAGMATHQAPHDDEEWLWPSPRVTPQAAQEFAATWTVRCFFFPQNVLLPKVHAL